MGRCDNNRIVLQRVNLANAVYKKRQNFQRLIFLVHHESRGNRTGTVGKPTVKMSILCMTPERREATFTHYGRVNANRRTCCRVGDRPAMVHIVNNFVILISPLAKRK